MLEDRYVITAYTVVEAGFYTITNSRFDLQGPAGDGNTVKVFVNDRIVQTHEVDAMGADDEDVGQSMQQRYGRLQDCTRHSMPSWAISRLATSSTLAAVLAR